MNVPRAQSRVAIAVSDKTADSHDVTNGNGVSDAPDSWLRPITTIEEHSARDRGRLLLAEDDASNQLFARHLLELDGWQVSVVENGREAAAAPLGATRTPEALDCEPNGEVMRR